MDPRLAVVKSCGAPNAVSYEERVPRKKPGAGAGSRWQVKRAVTENDTFASRKGGVAGWQDDRCGNKDCRGGCAGGARAASW